MKEILISLGIALVTILVVISMILNAIVLKRLTDEYKNEE